jgi:hypothetical protein
VGSGSGSGHASAWDRARAQRQRGIGDEEDFEAQKRKDIWASNAVVGRMAGQFSTLHASRIHASTLHGHLAEHVSRLATTRCTRAPRQPTRCALIAVAGRKALHLCLMFCTVDLIKYIEHRHSRCDVTMVNQAIIRLEYGVHVPRGGKEEGSFIL